MGDVQKGQYYSIYSIVDSYCSKGQRWAKSDKSLEFLRWQYYRTVVVVVLTGSCHWHGHAGIYFVM